jgi:hypothetical protein
LHAALINHDRAEQLEEHAHGVSGRTDFEVHALPGEVDAEVEEWAAFQFGRGQRGDLHGPAGGHAQADPLGDRLALSVAEQVLPLADSLAHRRAAQRAGHGRTAPCLLRRRLLWRRGLSGQGCRESAMRVAAAVTVGQGVQVVTGGVQGEGKRRQFPGLLLCLSDPGCQPQAQAVAHLGARAVRPDLEQSGDFPE